MLWTACCVALLTGDVEFASPAHRSEIAVTGTSSHATSPNFTIWNYHAGHDARQIAGQCECWRTALQQHWSTQAPAAWNSKCTLVIHSGSQSYLTAVGWGGSQTFGSSSIGFDDSRRVNKRRIDVRGDSPHGLASVPHELTHVVLADLLGGRQPPRWADEGMAMLADPREKQLLHERDLHHGLANQRAFRVVDLVTIENYPDPSRIPAFYGQSASLTAYLAARDTPARFVDFLRLALDQGYDAALRRVYGISNLAELEQAWRTSRRTAVSGYRGVRAAFDQAASAGAE